MNSSWIAKGSLELIKLINTLLEQPTAPERTIRIELSETGPQNGYRDREPFEFTVKTISLHSGGRINFKGECCKFGSSNSQSVLGWYDLTKNEGIISSVIGSYAESASV
jgi:hypothetical protein